VTELRRWAAVPPIVIPAIVLALLAIILLAACGPTTQSPASAPPSTTVDPSLTPVPGGSVVGSASPVAVTQTNTQTDVGRIWDSLPPSFPRIPGAVPIEVGSDPTSGTFAVGASVDAAVGTIRAGLTGLGYNVDVGTPLEDGSVVLDAGGGEEPECRIEVRFTPRSGTTTMAVLYGAACPFG
jgi:hypothetical protein